MSYTVDTLQAIHDAHPDAELTLIVGADTARTLPGWREPGALLEWRELAVAGRDGLERRGRLRLVAVAGRAGRDRSSERDVAADGSPSRCPPRRCARGSPQASPSPRWSARGRRLYRRARSVPPAGSQRRVTASASGPCRRPPASSRARSRRARAAARGDRALRRRQEGRRGGRARPARGARLHRLVPDLHRQHRAPDQSDPRRHPRGLQARARYASAPGRGLEPVATGS